MDDSHFMGKSGFSWWHGIVEDRQDPLKVGRARVRVFGWHAPTKTLQPTEQLHWAHPVLPLNTHSTNVKPPREGTMVFGYFMDGDAGQYPVMLGVVPGIPDQTTDPSHGFSDPRNNQQLQSAPRPPQSISYPTDGSGAKITEASNANRYPNNLNEPTTSRIARNENINQTIVQTKLNNTISGVAVATGGIEIPGIDLHAVIQLPSITIPPFNIAFNQNLNLEFCGIGINASLSAGFSFGGLQLTPPIILLDGTILIGGIHIDLYLNLPIAIGLALSLAIDIAGCLIGGFRIGDSLVIDGGFRLPLLQAGASINLLTIGIRGTTYGGISLGTIGGIPASSTPMWNEPPTPYNANYPYNYVNETESGHVIEIDDTPGAERLHTYHRSGTFDEMHPNGDRVQKTVNNAYQVTYADNNTNVMGSHHTTVQKDQTNKISGDQSENIDGSSTRMIKGDDTETIMGASQLTVMKDATQTLTQNRFVDVKGNDQETVEGIKSITVLKDCNIIVQGDCTLATKGKLIIGSTGDLSLISGGTMILQADTFALNVTNVGTATIGGNWSLSAKNLSYTLGNYTATLTGTYATTGAHTFMNPIPNH